MVAPRAVVVVVVAVVVTALASILQKSCPIDPLTVDFGPLPAGGVWAHEFNLQSMERIEVGEGPEDVVFDKQGRAYTGCVDGWLKRIDNDGKITNFSYTGGRPLGLAIGGDPNLLYLADSRLGLFEISLSDGSPRLIANKDDEEGIPIGLADAVAVTTDGVVYFTDASVKFSFDYYILDFLESRPNGRLLKYDPATKTVTVVKKNLWFANGLTFPENEDYLLICETSRGRVMRLWLKGEKEGTLEVFLDGLPGYPDNVKYHDGNFYIGLVSERRQLTDWIFKNPLGAQLRRIVSLLPTGVLYKVFNSRKIGRLVVVNEQGQFVKKYEDPTGQVMDVITGGTRNGDYIYLSSLVAPFLGRIKVT